MRKALTIARHEFRVTLARRSFQVMTFLLPALGLVGLLVFLAIQGRVSLPGEAARFGYVDGSGLFTAHREQPGAVFIPYPSQEAARTALLAGEVEAYYYIPPHYLDTGLVVKYTLQQGLDLGDELPPALKGFLLNNLLEDIPQRVAQRVASPAVVSTVRLTPAGEAPPVEPGRMVFFFALAGLLVMSIFMSSGFLLQGIGEEKESRIMEVLLSSVTPGQLMVGKILGLGAAGLAQIAVWITAGLVLLRLATASIPPLSVLRPPGALSLLGLLYFILGYLLFATLMAALGSVSATAREGQQISGLFVIPAIVPFYAFAYIVSHPGSPLAVFLTLFPLTAPVTVMQRVAVGGIAPWELAASAAVLTLAALVALWATGRLFRAYLLMYGKRPGLREIWRALRQG